MAVTIDELDIQIQGSAGNAAVEIEKTATALGTLKRIINESFLTKLGKLSAALDKIKAPISVNVNLKGMEAIRGAVESATANMPTEAITPIVGNAGGAVEELREMTTEATRTTKELKNTGKAATDTGKKLKEVGGSATHGASGLSKFVSSLKRIALYRVVRSILSGITNAAKEGIQNLVLYSKAVGGVDASRANATMSQFATIGLQVKNTLGAALMPALKALMPVIQTVANWFITAANAVNQFFAALSGASTWTRAKTYAVDYADGLDKAAAAQKRLNSATLSFDELNVISRGDEGGTSFRDMFEEVEVSSKVKVIANTVKLVAKELKNLIPTLATIGSLFAALWAFDKISKLISLLGAPGLYGVLVLLSGALVSFSANVWAAEKGTQALGYAVTGAISAVGGIITAFGPMRGSTNLALVGIGLIIGAIAGLVAAQKQLLTEKVSEWFYAYNEGKLTITQFAHAYSEMADGIIARKKPIIDGFAAFKEGKKNIAEVSQGVDGLLQSVLYATDGITEKIPEIIAAFDKLLDGTQTTLDTLRNNIFFSLAGATGAAYAAMGGDLDNIYALLGKVFGAANTIIAENKKKIDELTEQYNKGDIDKSAFVTGLIKAKTAISSLTQESLPAVDNFKTAAQMAFDGVEFENSTAVSEALDVFSKKTQAAKNAILEAAAAEQAQLAEVRRMAQALGVVLSPEQEKALSDWQTSIATTMSIDTAEIDKQFQSAAAAISTNLLSAAQGIAEAAQAEWAGMTPIERWVNGIFGAGSEAEYVEDALKNYKKTIITPMQKKLIEINGSIGEYVSDQTSNAFDLFMDELFDISTFRSDLMLSRVVRFKTDIGSALKKPLQEIGEAMSGGVAGGVDGSLSLLTDAMTNAAYAGIDAYADAQESGSPAKEYIEQSLFAMQGLKKGIDDNKHLVTDSLKSLLNGMLRIMEQFTGKISVALNGMLFNFTSTMDSLSVGIGGSVSFNRMQATDIQGFTSGGYPTTGQMFLARESGPEMVGTMGGRTAVVSNAQIEEGIAAAVGKAEAEGNALLREQNGLLRSILEKQGSTYLDGKKVNTQLDRVRKESGVGIFANPI